MGAFDGLFEIGDDDGERDGRDDVGEREGRDDVGDLDGAEEVGDCDGEYVEYPRSTLTGENSDTAGTCSGPI